MGQAAIDLPDPLQQPRSADPSSAAAAAGARPPSAGLEKNFANADDLLSKLAGEEIDRLLAEAESALPPSPGALVLPEEPEPASALAHRVDGNIQPVKSLPAEAAAESKAGKRPVEAAAKPVDALDAAIAADAASALAPLEQSSPPIAPPAPSPPPSQIIDAPQSRVAPTEGLGAALATATAAVAAEAATSPLERSALAATTDEASDGDPLRGETDPAIDAPVPLYLKPLVWLNAPLALCPISVREALGKVALLTMLNALAVLIYVLIFRRPHH